MNLTGQKIFRQTSSELWPRLSDMSFLVACLPDLHAIKSVAGKVAEVTLRPGFSFARSEIQLRIDLVELSPPASARFRFSTKGIGSNSIVAARFQLVDQNDGCVTQWEASIVQLGGLLKAVPSGLIQAGAEKVITDLLNNIDANLTT